MAKSEATTSDTTGRDTTTSDKAIAEEASATEPKAPPEPFNAPEPFATATGGVSDEQIRKIASAVSGARIGIGVFTILLPGVARRIMGLGADQDTAGLRMMARLFGVREIAVGAHALLAVQDSPRQPDIFAMNAAVDAGDATVLLMTLARGKGARRAAVGSLFIAAPIVSTWLWLRRASTEGAPAGTVV